MYWNWKSKIKIKIESWIENLQFYFIFIRISILDKFHCNYFFKLHILSWISILHFFGFFKVLNCNWISFFFFLWYVFFNFHISFEFQSSIFILLLWNLFSNFKLQFILVFILNSICIHSWFWIFMFILNLFWICFEFDFAWFKLSCLSKVDLGLVELF